MSFAVGIDFLRTSVLDHEVATALRKFLHPAGEFDALIDRLAVVIESRFPEERSSFVWSWDGEGNAVGIGTIFLPEIDSEIALILKGVVKHELAGSHATVEHLLRSSIAYNGDIVVVLLQA